MKTFLPILLLLAGQALATQPQVSNISASQRAGTYLVDVDYDLWTEGGHPAHVHAYISTDGGQTWPLHARTVSGQIGYEVLPGSNRHFEWDAGADYPHHILDNVKVKVVACRHTLGAMAVIPSGQFEMGETGVATPVHTVHLNHAFQLDRYEVSNLQYMLMAQWAIDNNLATVSGGNLMAHGEILLEMGATYSEITNSGNTLSLRMAPGAGQWGFNNSSYDPTHHPVKEVSWYGAACYCDWLSLMEGLEPYYNGQWSQIPVPRNPYAAEGYRLPTEAEWEYAAQWNDERSYPWGNDAPTCDLANFNNSPYCVGWTAPVGSTLDGSSALGLHDMAGNLWEWCNDWHAGYTSGTQYDPTGPASGSYRVRRGGDWYLSAPILRCAYRYYSTPSNASYGIGFRLCRTLP
jgi:formylglycine-generating enzyme